MQTQPNLTSRDQTHCACCAEYIEPGDDIWKATEHQHLPAETTPAWCSRECLKDGDITALLEAEQRLSQAA